MPNRILREGILTSEAVDSLSEHAELFYRRLLSVVDDHGLFYGNPKLIRAACYPLRLDRVSDDDVRGYLEECLAAGLVSFPSISGKTVIIVRKFGQHVRAKTSKYLPGMSPSEVLHEVEQMQAADMQPPCNRAAYAQRLHSTCAAPAKHPLADARLDGDGDEGGDEGGDGVESAHKPSKRSPRGSRIPPDFPTEAEIAWCRAERPTLDPGEVAEKFRDYWRGVPGQRGCKADWPATWRNFVRSEWSRSPPARASPTRQDRISATVAELTGRNHHPEIVDVIATERTTGR